MQLLPLPVGIQHEPKLQLIPTSCATRAVVCPYELPIRKRVFPMEKKKQAWVHA